MADQGLIWVYRETDNLVVFSIRTAAGAADDVTGWSLAFTVRAAPGGAALFTAKTVGSGITITGAGAGVLQIEVDASDLDVAAGEYLFALTRTDPGSAELLADGVLTVIDHAGRAPDA